MSIITNSTAAFFRRSTGAMADLRAQAETLQARIGSGERLERSSDDPLAASRLRSLSRADALGEADGEALSRASSDLALAGEALAEMADTLIRARELAQYAANGALGDDQRALIAAEIEQLADGLFASANAFGLSGQALFAGEGEGPAYLRDASGVVTYTGAAEAGTLILSDGTSIGTGQTGPEVLPTGTAADPFVILADLANALRGGAGDPATAARDALGGLETSLESVTRAQTTGGARLAWIEVLDQRLTRQSLARSEESADVGGADLASTIAELQQTLTALEASQASFSRMSQLSLFDAI